MSVLQHNLTYDKSIILFLYCIWFLEAYTFLLIISNAKYSRGYVWANYNFTMNYHIGGMSKNLAIIISFYTIDETKETVKTMLVKLGINASRIDSKGYGVSNPVSENSTPEGKANNRRVEFIKI